MSSVLTLERFHALPRDAVTPRHQVLGAREWTLPASRNGGERVRVVLLSGGVGDYSVYVGVGSAEWVADHGNKVPFEVAKLAFPGIEEARYRP